MIEKRLGHAPNTVQSGWGDYDRAVGALEAAMKPGPWLFGEAFTAADLYVGSSPIPGMQFGLIDSDPPSRPSPSGLRRGRPSSGRARSKPGRPPRLGTDHLCLPGKPPARPPGVFSTLKEPGCPPMVPAFRRQGNGSRSGLHP
ncbi:MAG: hypothetical protein U1E87_00755 [Alphaproteobacteria bacterium]